MSLEENTIEIDNSLTESDPLIAPTTTEPEATSTTASEPEATEDTILKQEKKKS